MVRCGETEEGGVHDLFASRWCRVVTACSFAVVFSAACGGVDEPSVTCGEVSPADMNSGILTAVYIDEFEERGVEPTPERLQAARATLGQLCSESAERSLIGAAAEAAGMVAERAQK